MLNGSWLVGTSRGVYASGEGGTWERLGAYRFRITAFARSDRRLLAATGSGLWELSEERWLQRHDETLTEVMDVIDEEQRIVAASAYGLALGETESSGATRWVWLSDGLTVSQRFTNTILRLGDDHFLAGTEAGVLIYDGANGWLTTSLQDLPIRSLIRWQDHYLAGSDRGLWYSDNGVDWSRTGTEDAVYALATAGDNLLAGTEQGVSVSADARAWHNAGLEGMRVSAIAADARSNGHWYVGGSPGGLWMTQDHGRTWVGFPEIPDEVEAISAAGARL